LRKLNPPANFLIPDKAHCPALDRRRRSLACGANRRSWEDGDDKAEA
jgi:hypothetical protein